MKEKQDKHTIYKIFTIDKCICNHLAKNYFYEESNRYYADRANISEAIIRKIKSTVGYKIPVSTLKKITDSLDIPLSSFLKEVEELYSKEMGKEYIYYKKVKDSLFVQLEPKEVQNLKE